MSDFETRWRWIAQRAGGEANLVQERHELEYIYNLMEACKCGSYLEVGSAEGASLYVLGRTVRNTIDIIDLGEPHTQEKRDEVIRKLGKPVREVFGDSRFSDTYKQVENNRYDCILIDGGHDYATVLSDARIYGPLANKYIFFHDIKLPQVERAVNEYREHHMKGEYSTFINSNSFGYGVIKCH